MHPLCRETEKKITGLNFQAKFKTSVACPGQVVHVFHSPPSISWPVKSRVGSTFVL